MSAEPAERPPARGRRLVNTAAMDIKEKQAAYHDWEAQSYEQKFSISYDERCIEYARDRFRKVIPRERIVGDVLEVGAGTGFFLINLALAECIGGNLHASDISSGMLEVCRRNGEEHGLDIATQQGDAEDLPYEDEQFDLVIGHAFIHHLPVPGKAIQEMLRVLRPGGQLVIAGEPTELGDRIATVVKRGTWRTFRAVTSVPGMRRFRKPTRAENGASAEAGGSAEDAILSALEDEVDLHTFRPKDVAHMAGIAGFVDVSVVTEELTANWAGWAARTLEGSVAPGTLGLRWALFAYGTYKRLTWVDENLLRPLVPAPLFYNLILHARKPVTRP